MFRLFYEAIYRGCVRKVRIFKKHVYALVHCINTSHHLYTVNQCIDVSFKYMQFCDTPLKMAS
jgi:hypothetical protein